ncbi:integrase [Actinosynnema sp. NPDC059335]|uniref:integrase n=1 Tax=Actinosynnema sp. NPDC059335 TaxID=3346804 RepID=UPI00366DA753
MRKWFDNHPVGHCTGCLGWGHIFARRLCAACYVHDRKYPQGRCRTCRRKSALKQRHCRLCWDHARTLAHQTGDRHITATHMIAEVRDPQLFLTNLIGMPRRTGTTSRSSGGARRRAARKLCPPPPEPPPAEPSRPPDGQLCLFRICELGAVAYDDHQHQSIAGRRALDTALDIMARLGETNGWSLPAIANARRALVIMLAGYAEGDRFTYSRLLTALRRQDRRLSIERTTQILDQMGAYIDDRRPRLDTNLEAKLVGLAPGIATETSQWVRTLVDGGPRRRPRSQTTALRYLHAVHPLLLEWSQRYDNLREVTRDDVLAHVDQLTGNPRQQLTVALRSLFGMAKKAGVIFRDPTSRIRVGAFVGAVLQPLPDTEIRQTVAAATRPADPLIVALATIHAARGHHIRKLLLDDVDLGNRRIILGGRVHPLDELTHRALLSWLKHRRTTWTTTPNPHLFINMRTASTTAKVSHSWLSDAIRGLPANLERLRMDRQLEEAVAHRADPLHIAAVFGVDEKTALRYANSARQLLATAIEGDTLG